MDIETRQAAVQMTEQAELLMLDADYEDAYKLLQHALAMDPLNEEANRLKVTLDQRLAAASGQTNPIPGSTLAATQEVQALSEARQALITGYYPIAVDIANRVLADNPNCSEALDILSAALGGLEVSGDYAPHRRSASVLLGLFVLLCRLVFGLAVGFLIIRYDYHSRYSRYYYPHNGEPFSAARPFTFVDAIFCLAIGIGFCFGRWGWRRRID